MDMSVEQEILETGIKVVDMLAPYCKGGKIGRSFFPQLGHSFLSCLFLTVVILDESLMLKFPLNRDLITSMYAFLSEQGHNSKSRCCPVENLQDDVAVRGLFS